MPDDPHSPPRRRLLPFLVMGCFLLTGATGLIFETVWGRFLQLFTGSTTLAHTIVLACFMGGIALGNRLLGRRADRAARPLRLYGMLELGVGVYGVLFPQLIDALGWLYVHAQAGLGSTAALRFGLKLLFALIVLAPPTVLIGGTLPVLAKALVRQLPAVGPQVARLYFLNSFGAVVGTLLAGFYLIEAVGLDLALVLPGFTNVLIGGAIFLFSGPPDPVTPAVSDGAPSPAATATREGDGRTGPDQGAGRRRLVLWCIGLSGGLSFLLEIVWFRLLGVVFGATSHSFSVMLATFITGITLGSWIAGRLLAGRRDPLLLFGLAEAGLFVGLLLVLPLYERLPYYVALIRSVLTTDASAFPVYLAAKVLLAGLVMIVPTTFIGMTLPLATAAVVRSLPSLGQEVGSVFSVNTLGGVAGVSLTGLVLLPLLGVQPTLLIGIAAAGCLGAAILAARWRPVRRTLLVAGPVVGAGVLVGLWLMSSWDPRVMHAGAFRRGLSHAVPTSSYRDFKRALTHNRKVLFEASDAEVSVVVIEVGGRDRALFINGKPDASTGPVDMPQQLLLGHLGMLLHPEEKPVYDVLVVGFGSGGTAGATLSYPRARVDLVELSPAVMAAAPYFEAVHDGVTRHPRFRLHVMDVKEFLLLHPGKRYDLIVSEPSNPWVAGEANLFTREQFALYAKHLTPRGLLLQWVQCYEFNQRMLKRVFQTFHGSFQHASLWSATASDLMLVGAQQPLELNPGRLRRRLQQPTVQKNLAKLRWSVSTRAPLFLLSRQMVSGDGFARRFKGRRGQLSERSPWLEFEAARALFVGASPQQFLQQIDQRLRGGEHLLAARLSRGRRWRDTELWELARTFHTTRSVSGPRLARAAMYALYERHPDNQEIAAWLLSDPRSHFSNYLVVKKLLEGPRPLTPPLCKFVWDTLQGVKFDASALYFQVPPRLLRSYRKHCPGARVPTGADGSGGGGAGDRRGRRG